MCRSRRTALRPPDHCGKCSVRVKMSPSPAYLGGDCQSRHPNCRDRKAGQRGPSCSPGTAPVQAAAPAVEPAPEQGPPKTLATPPAVAIVEALLQDNPPAVDPVAAREPVVTIETEKPRTRSSNEPATNAAHQTLITGRHGERIAIHYHSDIRSRSDAQRISVRLGSAGMSTVEMHSTAHIVPLSLVRYFSRQDASAAVALAKGLGSKTTDWHVDDCTAYQHKPERGTIQLWPATVATPSMVAHQANSASAK